MGLYSQIANGIDEVDVIVAGGGTAGCIVAGRLAEWDPNLSILVIEGGANNKNVPHIEHPIFYQKNLLPATKTALFYRGNKAKELADREPIVVSGGVLGGGSSINFMMYTRAQRSDYNSWKMPGWSTDELLPFLKKLETFHGAGDEELHGYDGPIHVSDGGYRAKCSEDDFIRAAGKVGLHEVEDLQNLKDSNGASRWQRYVSPDGQRQDTAHRYIHPKLEGGKYPNLHVLVESKVIRVLFNEDKRATGVEYTPNPEFQAEIGLSQHPVRTVHARKLVVVTCGACGTPPVLERSGVGEKRILESAGVAVVENLPGVGKDYQDHHLLVYGYETSLGVDQTNNQVLGDPGIAAQMIENKDKMLGWNAIDVSFKLRPTEEEVDSSGSEYREAWNKDFKNAPDRPLMLLVLSQSYLGDPSPVSGKQCITTGTFTAYPYSRGHMHITGPNHDSPLDFNVGFFSDKNDIDLKKQIWAYKKQREILRRADCYRGEVAVAHPAFPAHSSAAIAQNVESGLGEDVKDLVYSAEDDAIIEDWLRKHVNTTWHSLGTCKMAAREQDGVVDGSLSVYGVQGLKVADMSIAPENVGANTNNTAMMIGEKAADIIIRELRQGVGLP